MAFPFKNLKCVEVNSCCIFQFRFNFFLYNQCVRAHMRVFDVCFLAMWSQLCPKEGKSNQKEEMMQQGADNHNYCFILIL